VATRFVTVQTIVRYGDGSLWPNAEFQFWTSADGLSSTAIIPQSKKRLHFYSNDVAVMIARLWDNSEGLTGTQWHCKHPSGQCAHFTINAATPDPVELSVLEQAGIGPSDPNYDTIITAILGTGSGLLLPSGGNDNDVLTVTTGVPRTIAWRQPSGGTASTVTLSPAITISGVSQTNIQSAIASLVTNMPFERTFQQSDLTVVGVLPVVHNLGTETPRVSVWNNNNTPVVPDNIVPQGTTALGVIFESFMPILGVWRIKVGS
jgi:hypothetical protein